MIKEEILKIQTCVLKVNIHCDGCKHKVKKILQKVEGVYTIKIDSEQGKVTVSGNVDPLKLIKKLEKSGKHAEIWGSRPTNNNQNQLNNQLKNMQIGHEKNANNKNQKNGGGPQAEPNNQQFQQQLQKMKGFQDLKLPNLKDLNVPFKNQNQNLTQNNNQKGVKFNLPDNDDDMTDDEYDDDDDYDDDDEFEDDMHHQPLNKMKNGQNLMMMNGMMNPQLTNPQAKNGMMNPQLMNPQLMNAQLMNPQFMNPQLMNPQAKNGMMNPQFMNPQHTNPQAKMGGPVNPINSKKGGGNVPIQMNGKGGGGTDNKGGNGGKKGGGGSNGGKIGGGDAKNGNTGGGGNNKNGGNGGVNGTNGNGAKKGGAQPMNNTPFGFQNMGPVSNNMNIPIGQMGQFGNMPRGVQLGGMQAVQGLPAAAMNGGGSNGNGGYFQGIGPGGMNGDPSYQHQLAAAMMNQQRAMGNERFQPMMYARPPPAVNYMPPYPYPHPYQHPQPPHQPTGESYTNIFSDENTSSCNVM